MLSVWKEISSGRPRNLLGSVLFNILISDLDIGICDIFITFAADMKIGGIANSE